MIAGVFVRNIKCYANINFISLIEKNNENISVFAGDNGVGKSTVLESINYIMNDIDSKTWEKTLGQKSDRVSVCPVFLIEKENSKLDEKVEHISNCFWNDDFTKVNPHKSSKDFILWREELKNSFSPEKYYLIIIGKDISGNILLHSTYHGGILAKTKRNGVSKALVQDLFKSIKDQYSYIYIPIESKIKSILSLQGTELQSLMDKSVKDEIKKIIDAKEHSISGEKRNKSLEDIINNKLDHYIEKINSEMSEGYKFSTKNSRKKKVKSDDIVKVILSEYFEIRPLSKDGKSIDSLSSGQQRLALIDTAVTLLSSDSQKSKKVILAIDEPESSLESFQRLKQFSRIVSIAENYDHQIILTTHWYGLLLKPIQGRLHYINNPLDGSEIKINNFSLESAFDERRGFPASVEMKSYFDLMGSMLTVIKNENEKWLICEGKSDAKYLNLYLKDSIENLNILPFNGSGNIRKLFKFLDVPFSDENEFNAIKGKILCLIDNDTKNVIIEQGYNLKQFSSKLRFNRILISNNKFSLISVADTNSENTVIEDILDPNIFWNSLQNVASKDETLSNLLKGYEFNHQAKYSKISDDEDHSMIIPKDINAYRSFKQLKSYLSKKDIKMRISLEYEKLYNPDSDNKIEIALKLEEFFNAQKKASLSGAEASPQVCA